MRVQARIADYASDAQAWAPLAKRLGLAHSVRQWRADRALNALVARRKEAFVRRMWAEAADACGTALSEPSPQLFEFTREGATVHVLGQRTPFADPVSFLLASAKDLAHDVLTRAGVPVPEQVVVHRRDRRAAEAFLAAGSAPCVVKPAREGGAGKGVVTSVVTPAQLGGALRHAGALSQKVVIQRQQLQGEHYRFLLLDGNLLDVVRRSRPRVIGDGESTIEQLILAEHDRRLQAETTDGLKPFSIDLDCLFTLDRQGLRRSTVPARGTTVVVKDATNISGSRECSTVTDPIDSHLLATVANAAAAVGVRLAGVDVITTEVSKPLAITGGVVLEVNPIPGLVHHYNVADPARATHVAIPILEALLRARSPMKHPA